MRRAGFGLLLILLLPLMVVAALDGESERVDIRPQVPSANRSAGNRVFLEHADVLHKATSDSFMVLDGNVEFTKGPMIMHCDSAHYFPDTESMDAFGNVIMEQGDTLFVYADELNYDGLSEVAYLYADFGKKVRLINKDVMLETDEFVYDLRADLGYYTVGGVLTDKQNRLSSLEGEYVPSTKEANFYIGVHLNSRSSTDTLDIYTDTLYYNTATHIAELYSPSEVVNARGTIYTREGVYNTETDVSNLYDRSLVVMKDGQTLQADTIFYDRTAGYGEAFGDMVMTDTAHKSILKADYGFYDELRDSSFATGRAQLMEYSQGDTLYIHGRYIQTFLTFDTIVTQEDTAACIPASSRVDTTHIAVVYPRVRFFRNDVQGICDSLRFTEKDSTVRMLINPVVWNGDRQIFGNVIELHLNDSTVDRATLPDFGFAAQHIEDIHYNQLSGKRMDAYFVDGEMRHLDVNGNVEIIMYPEENDSTINKIVNAQSSFLAADFKGRTTERIKMWPETTGSVTPLFLAKKSLFRLSKFKWFESMRPIDRFDIFVVPEAMEEMMVASGRPPTPKWDDCQNQTQTASESPEMPELSVLPEPFDEGSELPDSSDLAETSELSEASDNPVTSASEN